MRLLFMGTPDFSVPALQALIDSKHELVAVVSQPDRAKGRSKELQPTPVKALALANGIPVHQPNRVRQEGFLEEMAAYNIDLAIVIAFGQILPKDFLEMPKYGCINAHASLLPDLRGAGPIQWSIINGHTETGITTMYMDVGMDTGDMLLKEVIPIDEKETGGSLFDKLSTMGGPLILKTIDELEAGSLKRIPQDDALASYAPMLDKKLGNIKWQDSARSIERLVRGLNPWPSAYSFLDSKMLKIWEADVVELDVDDLDVDDLTPGSIFEVRDEGMVVVCGKNALLIKSLQLQGKKRMATVDFLRGYQLDSSNNLSPLPQQD